MGDTIYIYFLIFFSKIIENMLSTLRIIIIANGRKKLGALLQGIVALVWIFVTGAVIINVNKDPIKVFVFCAGSIVGSYIGSMLEEKVALGEKLLICETNKFFYKIIKKYLNQNNIFFNIRKYNNKYIYYIYLKRNKASETCKILKQIDKNITIISLNVKKIV